MEQISNLLKRFSKIGRPDILVREAVSKSIKKLLNTDIDPKEINVRNGIIYIANNSSSLKSEIFLKRNLLLEEVRVASGNYLIKDIK